MKVEEIITRDEFNAIKNHGISYEGFCDFVQRIIKNCVEESLKNLPHVITSLANQASYLKTLSEEFYKDNPDLAQDKELTAKTIERVEAENPGMTFKEVLSIAGPRAKQALTLKSQFRGM